MARPFRTFASARWASAASRSRRRSRSPSFATSIMQRARICAFAPPHCRDKASSKAPLKIRTLSGSNVDASAGDGKVNMSCAHCNVRIGGDGYAA